MYMQLLKLGNTAHSCKDVTGFNEVVGDLELKLSAGCYKVVIAVLLVNNLVTYLS